MPDACFSDSVFMRTIYHKADERATTIFPVIDRHRVILIVWFQHFGSLKKLPDNQALEATDYRASLRVLGLKT